MADFTGFTDEELQKLKNETSRDSASANLKSAKIGQNQRKKVREKMLAGNNNRQRAAKDIQATKAVTPAASIEREVTVSIPDQNQEEPIPVKVESKDRIVNDDLSEVPKSKEEDSKKATPPDTVTEEKIGILSDEK